MFRQAESRRPPLPVLRNVPRGIRPPPDADFVFLPRLTGASALRRTRGLPSVVVVHDMGVVDCPEDREAMNPWTRWALGQSLKALNRPSAIVTPSNFTRLQVLKYCPDLSANRVSVIPWAPSPGLLADHLPRAAARMRIQRLVSGRIGDPLLLYVGSESPRKNVADLLAAVATLKRKFGSVQLLKVGSAGAANDRSRTIASIEKFGLEAGRDVVFLDEISDSNLAAAYCASDIFVSASLYEGFGLPVLEAMALAVPVVTYDSGALTEVMGNGGRVVPPSPNALAAAVGLALEHPDILRSEAKARADYFSWTRTASQYLDVISSVLRTRGLQENLE